MSYVPMFKDAEEYYRRKEFFWVPSDETEIKNTYYTYYNVDKVPENPGKVLAQVVHNCVQTAVGRFNSSNEHIKSYPDHLGGKISVFENTYRIPAMKIYYADEDLHEAKHLDYVNDFVEKFMKVFMSATHQNMKNGMCPFRTMQGKDFIIMIDVDIEETMKKREKAWYLDDLY